MLSYISSASAVKDSPGKALRSERFVSAREQPQATPLIAICHLQWDRVWQRPQQFPSRLAESHPVLFVETHSAAPSKCCTRTRVARDHPGVTIIEVHLPSARWADAADIDGERRGYLRPLLELVEKQKIVLDPSR